MKLSAVQFDVLCSAYDEPITIHTSKQRERTVQSLTRMGLLSSRTITQKGRALLAKDYYRQPDDSVLFK